jgi:hypothetical protein
MSHRLSLGKKVSLEGLAEGWGEDCFVIVRPANYDDMLAVDEIDPSSSKSEQVRFQIDFVKDHFVSGKVLVDGQLEDMEPDDISESIALADRLFLAIIGSDLDPKDARAVAAAAAEQHSEGKPTETPSFTE